MVSIQLILASIIVVESIITWMAGYACMLLLQLYIAVLLYCLNLYSVIWSS